MYPIVFCSFLIILLIFVHKKHNVQYVRRMFTFLIMSGHMSEKMMSGHRDNPAFFLEKSPMVFVRTITL
jgi:glycerol uptake facilitator-like aquaporin